MSGDGNVTQADLHVVLVHHPVRNKTGETICSAVTNLDIHDIARTSRTFGVKGYYIVTTLEDQKVLTEKIVAHWTTGRGGELNPARKEALELVKIRGSLDEVVAEIRSDSGLAPRVVATSARQYADALSWQAGRACLSEGGRPMILIFGTAWGVTDEVIASADHVLEPVDGGTHYNHLPVRAAVAIILDRLLGRR
ncbi:RNA methyltransferase [Desulfoluna butyratoxydans]|uniref:Rna methyltransferase domain n=1 Tax=Desulfoluna butyratoxydans TaxID=231438 RepID=A0A4U8YPM5_9BACT|nr:RNA methyltransferase [Desulfoluna butyratoxydans]VFQ45730.1 rna methyltransferase domain [Desulfoluna butyratoxydans]